MAFDMIKGLSITLKNAGRKKTTISCPEQRRALPPRFRGVHVLHRYANGQERCVGCFLCAGACPADAIYIEAEENTPEHPASPGERYARVFDVNLLRCIFCGYCEQACPTGAITLGQAYELAAYDPAELIYHKEQLLEPEGQATRARETPGRAPRRKRRPSLYQDGKATLMAWMPQRQLWARATSQQKQNRSRRNSGISRLLAPSAHMRA
jgi:NADH-quinone oxidoreductase subunit I